MSGQFQFQAQESRYVVQLEEQIARMDREVEDGRTLTLELREGDQTLTLSVHRERVEPIEPPAVRPQTGKAASLERNDTMVAMMTGCYSFDLAEVNREVSPAYIEKKLRSPGRKMAMAAAAEKIPNPAIRWIGGNNWSLTEDCSYRADGGFTITAKTGFETDLASIPRFFWVLLSFHDLGIAPPTFHDLIYRAGGTVALPCGEVVPAGRVFTREEADDLFLELMTLTNIRWWKRRAAHFAVRRFGASSWRGH